MAEAASGQEKDQCQSWPRTPNATSGLRRLQWITMLGHTPTVRVQAALHYTFRTSSSIDSLFSGSLAEAM